MTNPTDEELDALVKLSEKFVTATWHLLDNSETSGPIDDPTIAVWRPDFDEVSALLDRCEGLPSGSTEHMNAGELLSANMTAAITALRAQLARREEMHDCAMKERDDATLYADEQKARADLAEAALAASIPTDPVTNAGCCQAPSPPEHYDDYCIRQFAKLMSEKMAASRAKGRSGWHDPEKCSVEYLRSLLYEHLDKGDPVDVANFCMMLRHYNASTHREFCNCTPNPAPVTLAEAEGHWEDFLKSAVAEAEKAMRKFPQPNYVISKVAEEAGEVVKAAIHCAEARETAENVRGEMRQLIAMLYRLWIEGDQVHGLPPVSTAALRAQLASATYGREVAEACNRGLVRLNEATQERADRAEAALAAQIETDAGVLDAVADNWSCGHMPPHCDCARDIEQWRFAADGIRNQPHDRTALDRIIADTRAEALRDAAKVCDKNEHVSGWVSRDAILATINKPIMSGDDTGR